MLEQIVRVNLVETIGERLEQLILAGTIRPGTRVNESHLAASLGTSRGPLREALRRLERTGLLEPSPNRGSYVRQISFAEGCEHYEIRAELEALAGRKACEHLTDADIETLTDLLDRMRKAASASKVDGCFRANLSFHEVIVRCAHNHSLESLYADLVKRITLFRLSNLSTQQGMTASLTEHRAILAALKARDAEKAGALLRNHVLSALARLTAKGDKR